MRYIAGPNSWLADQPAVLTRKVGKGEITYVGAWLDDTLMRELAKRLLDEAKVGPVLAGRARGRGGLRADRSARAGADPDQPLGHGPERDPRRAHARRAGRRRGERDGDGRAARGVGLCSRGAGMRRLARAALLAASMLVSGGPALAATAAAPALPVQSQRLWMGAAWYPEQWPEARWDKDLALMEAAGVTVVRVGEFAWSRMEPREGSLRSRLAGTRRSAGRKASHRRRHRHADRRAAGVAHQGASGDAAHRCDGPSGRARRSAAVLLLQPALPRLLPRHRRAAGRALRPRPERHRLADRQRVHRRVLRPRHARAVPGLAAGEVRDARRAEQGLDDGLLEPDLRRLGRDPAERQAGQSRPDARPPPLRHRHLALVPARPSSTCCARHDRPAPVHHHQHRRARLVRQLGPLRRNRTTSTSRPGTTTSARAISTPPGNAAVSDFVRGWKRQNFWVMETQPGS